MSGCNPNSVDDIRKKLEASLEKERTGAVSRIVEQDFSWERVTKQYVDVYNYVLKKDK